MVGKMLEDGVELGAGLLRQLTAKPPLGVDSMDLRASGLSSTRAIAASSFERSDHSRSAMVRATLLASSGRKRNKQDQSLSIVRLSFLISSLAGSVLGEWDLERSPFA